MQSHFSTYIEQKKLSLAPGVLKELQKTAHKLSEIDEAGIEWCTQNYRNGYTSYGSLSQLHQQFSVFEKLKTALDKEVKAYVKKLGFRFPTGSLELSSIWVNIMPRDCYHAFHAHPLSVVSGTFYVDVPKNGSPLRVEDPRAALFMASPARKIQHDLKPKTGEVILFESWLKHEVPPHSDAKSRVSVSFNYDWLNR